MTIEDIKELFDTLHENSNDGLAIIYQLGLHKEKYEESDFAKTTGLSIYEAYEIYFKTSLAFYNIYKIVQDVIDHIDYKTLNNNLSLDSLFEQIPEEYAGIMKQVIETVKNTEEL